MRSPLKPVPARVTRWAALARAFRWLDALVAWLALWGGAGIALPGAAGVGPAGLAAVAVALGALAGPLRARWRPASGVLGLVVSARLRPGDRAWYVRPGQAERVLVTARRRTRMVVAWPAAPAEGLGVRRTRVLLLPDDSA